MRSGLRLHQPCLVSFLCCALKPKYDEPSETLMPRTYLGVTGLCKQGSQFLHVVARIKTYSRVFWGVY